MCRDPARNPPWAARGGFPSRSAGHELRAGVLPDLDRQNLIELSQRSSRAAYVAAMLNLLEPLRR